MKKSVDIFAYAETILKALPKGILLTTACDGKVNTMTIGWGSLGVNWRKPVFTAYIRESRYTRPMLEKSREFTINVPLDAVNPDIIKICGSKSGRDMDKIKELGLTLVPGEKVQAPAIKELPLTLECKVIYVQKQDPQALTDDIRDTQYPVMPPSPYREDDRDLHITVMGEIVAAYIVE